MEIVTADPDVVLTTTEIDSIKSTLARSAGRTRARLVFAYLLQGMTPGEMAAATGRSLQEVTDECQQVMTEVADQMDSQPEGPVIIGQLVLDGYARFMQRVMQATNSCVDKAENSSDPKYWSAASSLLRLSKETMDGHMDWMQKFGMLPNSGRPVGRPKKELDMSKMLEDLAAKAGTTPAAIEADIIAGAVGKKPEKPKTEED